MNYGISVLFRLIPLLMALICFFFGGYIFGYGNDEARWVAGPVVFSLGVLCLALYATAATIIRQFIHTYNPVVKYLLPAMGYLFALGTMIWGITLLNMAEPQNMFVPGHVICGVALIAGCISTAATSSTKFTLIPGNSHGTSDKINPAGFSATTESTLIGITIVLALVAWVWAIVLLSGASEGDHLVAGSVMAGLACICTSLIGLVASISRQIRNDYGEKDRKNWPRLVFFMGTICIVGGIVELLAAAAPVNTTGFILIGLGLVCFSISSKVLLLAKVWRQECKLANRIPLIPVMTALFALFLGAFLFEEASLDNAFFVPSRVLIGLGAICFSLFSIVSILESGTSSK